MAARQLFDEFVSGGEFFILQVIDEQREEGLYLDFKRGAEVGGKQDAGKCTSDDRSNLARVISGFANSDGGVAVWGVDRREGRGDSPSVAQSAMPIHNVQRFQNDLLSETSKVTSGTVGVEHKIIRCQDNPDNGYVITYVPKAEGPPVMALCKDMNCYWFRSGDSFRRMEPFMVADRFSRRPQPKLQLVTEHMLNDSDRRSPNGWWKYAIDVSVVNAGIGSALYTSIGIGIQSPSWITTVNFNVNQDLRLQRSHRRFPPIVTFDPKDIDREFLVSAFCESVAGQALHPDCALYIGRLKFGPHPEWQTDPTVCEITYELHCEGFSVRDEKEVKTSEFDYP
ncbi:MAG: ATP-binding protein [Armatimonadota bacterium]